jgi:hypothetical protein
MDPVVLRAAAAEAAGEYANPSVCLRRVLSILDNYSDRTYRPSPRLASSEPANSLQVPAPVLRTLVTALRQPVEAEPAIAIGELLPGLWASGSREGRRIAAQLLGVAAVALPAEAMALVNAWAPEIESVETASTLAEHGLGPILVSAPGECLQHARRWVIQPSKWRRCLGVQVLAALAKGKQWDDVPGALEVLRPLMSESDPVVRQAVIDALSALCRKSPAELVHFLSQQARQSDHRTHQIVRGAMQALPPEDQEGIALALRA